MDLQNLMASQSRQVNTNQMSNITLQRIRRDILKQSTADLVVEWGQSNVQIRYKSSALIHFELKRTSGSFNSEGILDIYRNYQLFIEISTNLFFFFKLEREKWIIIF